VTDSISGQPLNARVYISGHDIDSSHIFTDPSVGDYHRLLKTGLYNITFSSAGYFSKTIPVQVSDQQKLNLDVQLYNGRLKSYFTADTTLIPVGSSVYFTDRSVGNPQSWRWEFNGGTPAVSYDKNPIITYSQPGKYSVKLVIERSGNYDSVTRTDYIDVKQWYLMGNQTYTVCDALFFDSGGPGNSYEGNENSVVSFLPAESNKRLKATFLAFDVENSTDCQNDWLKVYDGISNTANLIGTYCGNGLPASILASNQEGALTFEFHSNATGNNAGWEAMIACDSNVGIEKKSADLFMVYPNPVTKGYLMINSNSRLSEITIFDAVGHQLFRSNSEISDRIIPCHFKNGIYFLKVQIGGKFYTQKIMVMNEK
jgi:PKD repeat protein